MFKKIFAALVMTSVMSSSAIALDFNPLIGFQFQAEEDAIGAETGLAIGGELIMKNNVLFGAAYSSSERDDLYGYTSYNSGRAEVENHTLSMWVGKIFENNFAGKVGLTHYESEMTVNSRYGWSSVSGSQTQLLVGTGYYHQSGFNISANLNIPLSGDKYDGTSGSDYTSLQVLAGYRF